MIHEIVSVLIILIAFIIYDEVRKWRIKKKLGDFESVASMPILGAAHRLFGKSNDEIIDVVCGFFDEVKTTPFQTWFGPVLVLCVAEPENIRILLQNDNCLNKPYFYDHLNCKTSIIATEKERWRPDRRALNTAFNVKMLQSYVPLLNEKSRVLIEKMKPMVRQPGDLYRTIFICMIDMVVRTTMGTEMHLQMQHGERLYQLAKQLMNNIQYRVARIWLAFDFTYSLSKVGRDERPTFLEGKRWIEKVYNDKIRELDKLKSQNTDYLEEARKRNATNLLEKCLILERDGIFSRDNVMDQMRVIILAGIDTSAITVFGALMMLAINQKHQELVVNELRSIFESADCDVTQSHLANMKYTERVIKESQRLLSPVPFIARKTTADIELPKGTVPSGTMVLINIMHLHRNPEIWGENAMEFDPDRFLPENVAKRPPFSYIPFSAGARNCIGMKYAMISAKITLAHLLRRYKFTTTLRFEDIRMKTHLVLEVTNDKPLRIEERKF